MLWSRDRPKTMYPPDLLIREHKNCQTIFQISCQKMCLLLYIKHCENCISSLRRLFTIITLSIIRMYWSARTGRIWLNFGKINEHIL